jgi:hypothetical protein
LLAAAAFPGKEGWLSLNGESHRAGTVTALMHDD